MIVQPVVEPMDPFAALVTIARAQGAVLRSPGPDIQSTDWRCPCQAVVLVVVAQAVVRRRQGDRVREGAVRYFGHLMVSRLLARVTRACTTLGTVLELEHAGNSRESVARHRCTAPPCCLSSAHCHCPHQPGCCSLYTTTARTRDIYIRTYSVDISADIYTNVFMHLGRKTTNVINSLKCCN